MARSAKSDPIRNFKFRVTIVPGAALNTYTGGTAAGLGTLGFAVVSGLTVTNELVGYREGGMNTHPHKFVGQSDFTPVNFSRGVFESQDQLYKWQGFLHSFNQASGASKSGSNDYRCDILVQVYDHPVADATYAQPQGGTQSGGNSGLSIGDARWGFKLFNCWPGSYSLSDLNAGDSGMMIQQMTIHHEGFVVAWNQAELNSLVGTNTTTPGGGGGGAPGGTVR